MACVNRTGPASYESVWGAHRHSAHGVRGRVCARPHATRVVVGVYSCGCVRTCTWVGVSKFVSCARCDLAALRRIAARGRTEQHHPSPFALLRISLRAADGYRRSVSLYPRAPAAQTNTRAHMHEHRHADFTFRPTSSCSVLHAHASPLRTHSQTHRIS